jgi:hypothetical protein
MRRVIIESPFAGATPELAARNLKYLRAAILDCVRREESPYASHRMLTDALNDAEPNERALGIEAGFAWRGVSNATIVYHDLGFSIGMRLGIVDAEHLVRKRLHVIEYRLLHGEWELGLSEVGRP